MDRRDEQNNVEPAPIQGASSTVSELRARLAQVEAAMDGVDRGLNARSDEARRAQVSRAISQNELQTQDAQDRRDRRGSRSVMLVLLLILVGLGLVARQWLVDDVVERSESMVAPEGTRAPTPTVSVCPSNEVGVVPAAPPAPGAASESRVNSERAIPAETLKQALMTLRADMDAASRVRSSPLALSQGLLPLLQRGARASTPSGWR